MVIGSPAATVLIRLLCALAAALATYVGIMLVPWGKQNDYALLILADRTPSFSESLDAEKEFLVQLIDVLPWGIHLGILDIDGDPEVLFEGRLEAASRTQVRKTLQQMTVAETGGTDLPAAFIQASALAQHLAKSKQQVLVLAVTDGQTEVEDPAAAEARLAHLQFPPGATVIFVGIDDASNPVARALARQGVDVQLVAFGERDQAIKAIASAVAIQPRSLHPAVRYGLPMAVGGLLYIVLSFVPWPAASPPYLTICREGLDEQRFPLPSGAFIEVGDILLGVNYPIQGVGSSVRFSQEDGRLVAEPSSANTTIAVRQALGEAMPLTARTVFATTPVTLVFDNGKPDTITVSLS